MPTCNTTIVPKAVMNFQGITSRQMSLLRTEIFTAKYTVGIPISGRFAPTSTVQATSRGELFLYYMPSICYPRVAQEKSTTFLPLCHTQSVVVVIVAVEQIRKYLTSLENIRFKNEDSGEHWVIRARSSCENFAGNMQHTWTSGRSGEYSRINPKY